MSNPTSNEEQKNIIFFNDTANNPKLWWFRSLDLHTASEVLRTKANEAMSKPNWQDLLQTDHMIVEECFKYGGLLFQAAMLQAFAIECMLKCYWLLQGNKVAKDGEYKIETIKRENHDLVAIAKSVGFSFVESESAALAKLSEFGRSFGRYPIAKRWQNQKLKKDKYGIDAGPNWEENDHQVTESVISRLKAEIQKKF